MQTYSEYFNMGGYVVDPTITPWGEPITIKKTYNETLLTPISELQAKKPMIDPFSGIEIQEEPEPAPMEEVSWENAYPQNMLPVENESDMWTHTDDIQTESVDLHSDNIELTDPVENHMEQVSNDVPVESVSEVEQTEDNSVINEPVSESVVKKKNTRRTKKNK